MPPSFVRSPGLSRLFAPAAIAANALTAGSMFTYPVFSPALQHTLNFSVEQISATASAAILFQYLFAAPWGSLADRRGPESVSFFAGFLFFIGYGSLAYLLWLPNPDSSDSPSLLCWILVTVAYILCGIATTASYLSALTASAQVFGSTRPGLSIALPSCLFGLSPLFFTFLGTRLFTHSETFDTIGYLIMMAVVTLTVNLIGALMLGQKKAIMTAIDERAPLLEYLENPANRCSPSLPDPSSDLFTFLSDPTTWLLGIAVLFAIGPPEMSFTSIGSVVDAFTPTASINLKANLVQVLSVSNSLSRILAGWLSDRFGGQNGGARLMFLASAPVLYCIVCLFFGIGGHVLWILSLSTGICYGMIFTLVPSFLATVWPVESFGRNYGILCYFSAAGSFAFTFVFGALFDEKQQISSIQKIYCLGFLSELLSLTLFFGLYRFYRSKGGVR